MNDSLSIVLTGDGPSDRSLLPLIVHLLTRRLPDVAIQSEWADLSRLGQRPKTIKERLRLVIDVYPSDIIFIHRDAEREPYARRLEEINDAVTALETEIGMSVVPVVPIRMRKPGCFMTNRRLGEQREIQMAGCLSRCRIQAGLKIFLIRSRHSTIS